jgi:hypothetical protein
MDIDKTNSENTDSQNGSSVHCVEKEGQPNNHNNKSNNNNKDNHSDNKKEDYNSTKKEVNKKEDYNSTKTEGKQQKRHHHHQHQHQPQEQKEQKQEGTEVSCVHEGFLLAANYLDALLQEEVREAMRTQGGRICRENDHGGTGGNTDTYSYSSRDNHSDGCSHSGNDGSSDSHYESNSHGLKSNDSHGDTDYSTDTSTDNHSSNDAEPYQLLICGHSLGRLVGRLNCRGAGMLVILL